MSGPARRALRRRLEAGALAALALLARALPARAASDLGAALGWIACSLMRRRRRVGEENLAITLGAAWSPAERRALSRRMFAHFGRTLVEYLRLPATPRAELARRVRLEGEERLAAALARGRGAVLVSAHYGSWQVLGAALAWRGYPVNYLTAPLRNPHVDRMQRRLGEVTGTRLIPRGPAGSRAMLRALARNEILILLADQHPGAEGMPVEFLGRPALAAPGPAEFALRSGAALLTAFIRREGALEHRLLIGPELAAPPAGAPRAAAAAYYTRQCVAAIEAAIAERPDQWLWGHRRWRGGAGQPAPGGSAPTGAPSPPARNPMSRPSPGGPSSRIFPNFS